MSIPILVSLARRCNDGNYPWPEKELETRVRKKSIKPRGTYRRYWFCSFFFVVFFASFFCQGSLFLINWPRENTVECIYGTCYIHAASRSPTLLPAGEFNTRRRTDRGSRFMGRFCAAERTVTLLFRETNKSYAFDVKKRVSLFIGEFFAYRGETKQTRSAAARSATSLSDYVSLSFVV